MLEAAIFLFGFALGVAVCITVNSILDYLAPYDSNR